MSSNVITKLVKHIIDEAIAKNLTIRIAEDGTGGMISCALTENLNSNKIFDYAVILSSDESRKNLLNIELNYDLEKSGEDICSQMALNLKKNSDNKLCLAVKGFIEDAEETHERSIAFIAVATDKKIFSEKYKFPGDRHDIRLNITESALEMLLKAISESENVNL